MTKSFAFPKRDDNSSEDAEKLVRWAQSFVGVDAHIVYDYIADGLGNFMRGALNGVTLQWDHDGDGNPDGAVHAPAGATVVRLDKGFEISFTTERVFATPEGEADLVVVSDVVRTVDGDDVKVVSA